MKRTSSAPLRAFLVAAACSIPLCTVTSSAIAASLKPISIAAREIAPPGGTSSYGITAFLFTQPNRDELLVMPSGREFTPSTFQIEYDTWQSLTADLFGEWKFRSVSRSNPLDVEEYAFSVLSFDQSMITVVAPTILQPAHQSVVSSPFDIVWSPPSESYGFGALNVPVSHELIEPGKLRALFKTPYSSNARINFSTSKSQSLPSQLSSVSGPAVDPLYELRPSLAYSRVTYIHVIPGPVPEPATFGLFAVGAALLAMRAPSQRRTRWRV